MDESRWDADKIFQYINKNYDEINRKLGKSVYEQMDEEYKFEQTIRDLIPCNDCIVRASCKDRYQTNWFSFTVKCEMLQSFNQSIEYVLKYGGYKKSPDYKKRMVDYVRSEIDKGNITI